MNQDVHAGLGIYDIANDLHGQSDASPLCWVQREIWSERAGSTGWNSMITVPCSGPRLSQFSQMISCSPHFQWPARL
jgi:hypothetical protein